jgi:antiviral helicase SKI2
MIKRSFSENSTQKALPGAEQLHTETSSLLNSIKPLACDVCNQDIEIFYECSARILQIGYQMKEFIIKTPIGIRSLSSGRVVVVNNTMYRNTVGVILKSGNAMNIAQTPQTAARSSQGTFSNIDREGKTFWVFLLIDKKISNDHGFFE